MFSNTAGAREGGRDFLAVSTAQFSIAFALNFMFVFLPFYIRSVSPMDEAATLRWTGLILGAASATATFGSAFWRGLSDRYSPKALFERGLISHAILVVLMAFTTDWRLPSPVLTLVALSVPVRSPPENTARIVPVGAVNVTVWPASSLVTSISSTIARIRKRPHPRAFWSPASLA